MTLFLQQMQETIFIVIGESLCGSLPGGVVGIGIIHAEVRTRQKTISLEGA
jgi:hypothetical protein